MLASHFVRSRSTFAFALPSLFAILAAGLPLCGQNQVLEVRHTANDGFFDVPANSALIAANLTVEAWLTYDESLLPPSGFRFPTAARKNVGVQGEEWFLRVEAGNRQTRQLRFGLRLPGGNRIVRWNFAPGAMLTPRHAAATYDGSRLRLFIDGNEVDEVVASGAPDDRGGVLRIGSGGEQLPENWSGTIEEFRVWSVARSSIEINSTILSFGLVGEPGLEGSWSMEGDARDASGNGNDGTAPGALAFPQALLPTPAFQVNAAAASFHIGTVSGPIAIAPVGGPFHRARTVTTLELSNRIAVTSDLPGATFELVFHPGTLVTATEFGALRTGGGQILNVSLFEPQLTFLNGGTGISFTSFPGNLSFTIQTPTPLDLAAQVLVPDPSRLDGLALSQGAELSRVPSAL